MKLPNIGDVVKTYRGYSSVKVVAVTGDKIVAEDDRGNINTYSHTGGYLGYQGSSWNPCSDLELENDSST